MKKGLLLLLGFILTLSVLAQVRTVTGKVVDDKGNPVPGASVIIRGTSRGIPANNAGEFSISAKPSDVLLITAANFGKGEVTIGNQNNLSITLKSAPNVMEEVVVTALGQTSKKAKVGYSTTTFNSEAINRTANVNAFDGLAGKVAGAEISSTGGPGSSTKIILRGYGVLTDGGNQPLYVIDGVPISNSRAGSSAIGLTAENDFGNGANDINPSDIESVTVLKGTAASSLYGSAARNGAIMITTKRGKAGKIRVDYSGSVNISRVGKLPILQNKFGQGWNSTFVLGENGSWGPRLDGVIRPWGSIVDNSQLIKPFSAINDNIRSFYTAGVELNNTIAISGGGDKSTFFFSYGNVQSDGVIPTNSDYLARNSLSLRTNNKFKNLTINTSFNYVNRKVNQPATGQGSTSGSTIFQDILQIPVDLPIHDFRDYRNKFFNVNSYFTPYAENPYYGLDNNKNTQTSDRFFGNLDLDYQFTTALSAQLRMGGDVDNSRGFSYNAVNAPDPGSWNKGGNTEGSNRTPDVGSVVVSNNYVGNINGDFILKYNKDINNNFSLDALAGVNYNQQDTKSSFGAITDLLIPGFYNLSNSTKQPTTGNALSHQRLLGVYGQATVGFKNQLFVTVNARNDWSSTLPIEHDHFFYPGANLSWLASNTFNLKNTPVSYLKFRAGYGKTGASAPVYSIYPVLIAAAVPLPFGVISFPFNGVSSFRIQNSIANANLKPVITTEAELGMDVRFLNGRIGLDAAVYDKKTDGQILKVPISPGTGYTTLSENLGLVSNKGIEISFDAKPVVSRNVTWSFNYNYTKNTNKVEHLSNGLQKDILFQIVGGAELDAVPGQTATGIYSFGPQMTADGKVIVSAATGKPLQTTNRIFYGNAENDYSMGFSNTLKFKEWQVNFSLDYRKGGVFYSKTAEQLLFTGNSIPTTYNDRRPFIYPNSVIQNGVDGSGKPIYVENTKAINENSFQDFFPEGGNPALAYGHDILDRSFLKLRDVSLSYLMPDKSKYKIHNLSITIYARNLLLWTPKSNMYIDPEASNFGNDLTSQFGEFETAPVSKQFGVALKANF
ncbi:MAG: SusC/RagA family TonB-linked outer membrane protein [Chitinophagaceae bacterium]|nr:SusC/RagA family TonB-linked outer membrane protein [Chitinophagaceae bacterium]